MPVVKKQVPPPPQKCDGRLYNVKASNTLFGIAQRFGATVQQILAANPQITVPDIIYVGQLICIPSDAPTLPPNEQFRRTYA